MVDHLRRLTGAQGSAPSPSWWQRLWTASDGAWHRWGVLSAGAIGVAAIVVTLALDGSQPVTVATGPELGPSRSPSGEVCAWTEDPLPATGEMRACLGGRTSSTGRLWSRQVSTVGTATVELMASYQNTSAIVQDSVVLRIEMPEEVTYLDGSTVLHNANGDRSVVDGIVASGIDIGSYASGQRLRPGHCAGRRPE